MNTDLQAYIDGFKQSDKMGSHFDFTIDALDENQCLCTYHAKPEHHNPNGILHGGALYSVMDSNQGAFVHYKCLPPDYQAAATGTATIKYFKPIVEETIQIKTWIEKHEGRKFFIHSVAKNSKDEVVAQLEEIWIGITKPVEKS